MDTNDICSVTSQAHSSKTMVVADGEKASPAGSGGRNDVVDAPAFGLVSGSGTGGLGFAGGLVLLLYINGRGFAAGDLVLLMFVGGRGFVGGAGVCNPMAEDGTGSDLGGKGGDDEGVKAKLRPLVLLFKDPFKLFRIFFSPPLIDVRITLYEGGGKRREIREVKRLYKSIL